MTKLSIATGGQQIEREQKKRSSMIFSTPSRFFRVSQNMCMTTPFS